MINHPVEGIIKKPIAKDKLIAMNTAKIINSTALNKMVIWLGEHLSPRAGYPVADFLADIISHRSNWAQPRALRANLWVATGCQKNDTELKKMVVENYRLSGRGYYDFYHLMHSPEEVLKRVEFEPEFQRIMDQAVARKHGTILALCHTGNQDLIGRAAVLRGMPLVAITAPEVFGSYSQANAMRREFNLEAYPASMEAVKKSVEHLRNGGTVATGVDRPFPDSNYRPRFFGRPAGLPVGPVRMALRLGLPVFACGCHHWPDHHFSMWASEAIEMLKTGDPDQDVLVNAERVLAFFEQKIRQDPIQWAMFYPVWPDAIEEMPK